MSAIRNVVCILILLLPGMCWAQIGASGFTVTSDPPGAEVMVQGALTVSGIAPVSFMQGLDGSFKVKVGKLGYETYTSKVMLQSGRAMSLAVSLTPKTAFKSSVRSLFVPGWGQFYSGRKVKGSMYMIMAAGALSAFLIANDEFLYREDLHDDLRTQYLAAETYDERERLYPLLEEARRDAYDAENVRRITIGVTIAVWSINLLDALFLFPDRQDSFIVDKLAVQPNLQQGGGRIVLSYDF
ncbi:MAG: PEGA domain-containing protein [candidate division Zixibacteria bacterium]|nr:PEGA domain-containing protein [candidate division Zixibacteria bacterium]